MSTKLTGIFAGASSGIGHAAALEVAERGAAVAFVARRQDRFDAPVTEIEQVGDPA